jgi:hypothetical protein
MGIAFLVSVTIGTASVGLCERVCAANHITNQVFITDKLSACLETQKRQYTERVEEFSLVT